MCIRDRFSEDALRILRGIRFAAQLGFELEDETREGMRLLAPTLRKISAERIQVELVKTLTSSRPDLLREAWKLGITKEFLPEFDLAMETTQETVHHMYTVGEHILHTLLEEMCIRDSSCITLDIIGRYISGGCMEKCSVYGTGMSGWTSVNSGRYL